MILWCPDVVFVHLNFLFLLRDQEVCKFLDQPLDTFLSRRLDFDV